MNIVPIDNAAPAPGSMLEHALRYAAIGWHVFPVWGGADEKCKCRRMCKSPGKHPVEHIVPRGQDDATTDPAKIRRWWAQMPDAGIGCVMRPSGLVAIDIDPRNGGFESIDDIEVRHGPLASDVMQFTQAGGEHRLFKLAADLNISLPGKLGKGIDVKRNGYIVLAPTKGIAGTYDWEGSSDPTDGNIPSPLPDWLRGLSQNHQDQAVETTVASRHVTEAQVGELRDALAVLSSDDRDRWVSFGMALRPLGQVGFDLWAEWSKRSEKFDPVDQIRVWRSFRPGRVNYESIFFAAQEAGWINPLSAGAPPPAVPFESVILPLQPTITTAPAHLLNPPGILGQVVQWIEATSRKPQPQFSVQAAIAFCATVMGRRYCTSQRNWPSLYLLNIGKSASGKEHGKWAVEKLLDACGLGHLIGPSSYTSNSGVLSALMTKPSHLTVIDEFGKVLEAASIKNSARANSALTALMEVWARCDGTMRPQGYSTFGMSSQDAAKMEKRQVINPALTLLGMTTPETFFDTIGSAAARDGFLNRIIIVESDIGRQAGQAARTLPIPDTVIEWAKTTHRHDGLADPDINATLAAVPRMVGIRDDAQAAFDAFERECLALMDAHDEHGMAEMFGRCNETAMKLSLIVAVACNWQAITAEHATWSIDYVRHYSLRTVERLKTSVADSEFEAVKKQVLALIRNAGPSGMTERELNKSSRKLSCLDQRGQMNVLNSLAFIGDISRINMSGPSGRGKPRTAWIAINGDKSPTDVSPIITPCLRAFQH